MTQPDVPIHLRVSNQRAYVWDVDDIATLRSKYHICGILTGTLPHLAQQNVFLGVPLVLMPEEVVLLIQKELAVVVDDPTSHLDANVLHLQRWNAERRQSVRQQIVVGEAKGVRQSSSGHATTEAAMRKRREREEKRGREGAKVVEVPVPTDGSQSLFVLPDTQQFAPGSTKGTATQPHNITVHASSTTLPWCTPSLKATHLTIDSAREAGIWTYPSNLHERALCGVFRGLWEQGFFMGSGIKFGGDYLVYPGDPLRFHSHFSVTVIDSPTASLRPMEIVAHGRLGTGTKKAHLLCGWHDEKCQVSYFSIEWSGFG